MNILDQIVKSKRMQLKEEMQGISIDGWKQRIKRPGLHKTLDFYGAIKNKPGLSMIAEVKKASPSKGVICESFDPLETAREYFEAGVEAVSVLTEPDYFHGSDEYLVKIRQALPVPILRKDFMIDLWQVYQSRCLGADAILLIAAILNDDELKKFLVVAGILGLECLVEVHDRRELERALEAGARMIGINNRDLKTFNVSLDTTAALINHIPRNIAVVSESGIQDAKDMQTLKELNVDAVLIGETLMRAASVQEKIRELRTAVV